MGRDGWRRIAGAFRSARWRTWLFYESLALVLYLLWSRVAVVLPVHPPGYDSLMAAIDVKDATEVRSILASGVDPNAYPTREADLSAEDDVAPINEACEGGSLPVVEALLDHGADPNPGDGWHDSPLAAAGEEEQLDVMALLLRRGAKVNDTASGSSALWRTAMDGKVRATAFLLAHGAKPDTRVEGVGSLLSAVKSDGEGKSSIARMLKQAGAKG